MKLTNEQIANFMMSGISNARLPIKLSCAISLNIKELTPVMEVFQEKRKELAEEFAVKDENGEMIIDNGMVKLRDDEAYIEQSEDLASVEVDVNISTVPIDILDKLDEDKFDSLSANQISAIDFMLEKGDINE